MTPFNIDALTIIFLLLITVELDEIHFEVCSFNWNLFILKGKYRINHLTKISENYKFNFFQLIIFTKIFNLKYI